MTQLEIHERFVPPHDPILAQVAEVIRRDELGSSAFEKLADQMMKVATGEQVDGKKMILVGLAAPQIGVSKRVILVDTAADGQGGVGNLRLFLNPEITWASTDEETWYEGCFSTSNLCGIVPRHRSIEVKAMNENGVKIDEDFSGYVARIFQHEIDHLNGHEFVTRIANDNDLHWVEPDERPAYRQNEAWRNWPVKCSRERWSRIKAGLG